MVELVAVDIVEESATEAERLELVLEVDRELKDGLGPLMSDVEVAVPLRDELPVETMLEVGSSTDELDEEGSLELVPVVSSLPYVADELEEMPVVSGRFVVPMLVEKDEVSVPAVSDDSLVNDVDLDSLMRELVGSLLDDDDDGTDMLDVNPEADGAVPIPLVVPLLPVG